MIRVFLDANVLFSASQSPAGRSALLITFSENGHCVCLASRHAIAEAQRNLEARYPHALERFEDIVSKLTIVREGTPSTRQWALQYGLPENDIPILAAAVQAKAHVLVTGDKTHFGHLFGKTLKSVKVLSLQDTLGLLLAS